MHEYNISDSLMLFGLFYHQLYAFNYLERYSESRSIYLFTHT